MSEIRHEARSKIMVYNNCKAVNLFILFYNMKPTKRIYTMDQEITFATKVRLLPYTHFQYTFTNIHMRTHAHIGAPINAHTTKRTCEVFYCCMSKELVYPSDLVKVLHSANIRFYRATSLNQAVRTERLI